MVENIRLVTSHAIKCLSLLSQNSLHGLLLVVKEILEECGFLLWESCGTNKDGQMLTLLSDLLDKRHLSSK